MLDETIANMNKISQQWNKIMSLAQSIVTYSNNCIDDPSKTHFYLNIIQSLSQQIIQMLKFFDNTSPLSPTSTRKNFKKVRQNPFESNIGDFIISSGGERSTSSSSSSPITSPIPFPPETTTTTTTSTHVLNPRGSPISSPTSSESYSNSDSESDDDHNISSISPKVGKLLPKKRGRPNQKKPEKCFICGSINTPEWRKGKDGVDLCNACGLKYIKSNKKELESKNKHSITNVLNPSDPKESNTEILQTQRQILSLQQRQQQTHSQIMSYKQSASNTFPQGVNAPKPPPTLKSKRVTKPSSKSQSKSKK